MNNADQKSRLREYHAKYYRDHADLLKERSRQYRAEHKDQHNASNRRWAKLNKEKNNAIQRKWQKDNLEKFREYQRQYAKRQRTNPRRHLSDVISMGINQSLRRGAKSNRRWEELVGYTAEKLKKHLESNFQPNMTWENYGSYWHIDHKIPVSAFNFETPEDIDFKRCWALKNLQPLEARRNISKHDKVDKPFQPSLIINAGGDL